MKLSKLLCLVKHAFGRYRRMSLKQAMLRCPPNFRIHVEQGSADALRVRVCARCEKQEWQFKVRRKSPRPKLVVDNSLPFAPVAVSA